MISGITMSMTTEAKQLVLQYFHQLTEGCGRRECTNPNCASSPGFARLAPRDALVRALQLAKDGAPLCTPPRQPNNVPATPEMKGARGPSPPPPQRSSSMAPPAPVERKASASPPPLSLPASASAPAQTPPPPPLSRAHSDPTPSSSSSGKSSAPAGPEVPSLQLAELTAEPRDEKALIRRLGQVFSDLKALSLSLLPAGASAASSSSGVAAMDTKDDEQPAFKQPMPDDPGRILLYRLPCYPWLPCAAASCGPEGVGRSLRDPHEQGEFVRSAPAVLSCVSAGGAEERDDGRHPQAGHLACCRDAARAVQRGGARPRAEGAAAGPLGAPARTLCLVHS